MSYYDVIFYHYNLTLAPYAKPSSDLEFSNMALFDDDTSYNTL